MNRFLLRERMEIHHLSGEGKATDAELAQINSLPGVIDALGADDVIVRRVQLINDRPLRDGVRFFRMKAMEQANARLRGAPVMFDHPDLKPARERMAFGRVFDSRMTREGGVPWVEPGFYLLNDEEGQYYDRKIRGGLIPEASIGMEARLACTVCGEAVCPMMGPSCNHRPLRQYDGEVARWAFEEVADVDEFSMLSKHGAVNGTRYKLGEDVQVVDLDALTTRLAAEPEKPAPKGWDKLFPAHATLRDARREKFQGLMGQREAKIEVPAGSYTPGELKRFLTDKLMKKGSPAPQSGS